MSGDDPAFPLSRSPGLTKREHFAALALQGLLANNHPDRICDETETACAAVGYADALLAELGKERTP